MRILSDPVGHLLDPLAAQCACPGNGRQSPTLAGDGAQLGHVSGTGAPAGGIAPNCGVFDVDGDVDLLDYAAFQQAVN